MDDPLSPMANCNVEELRVHTQKMFLHLENAINQVVNAQMKHQNVIDHLPHEINAMKVFMQNHDGKAYEANITEAGRLAQQAMDTIGKVARDSAGEEHVLREQLCEFVVRLDDSAANLTKLENEYKSHIENNFNVIEKEFGDLRNFTTAAAATTGATAGSSGVAPAVNAFEFNIAQSKVQNLDKNVAELMIRVRKLEERCHCEHVDKIAQEVVDIKSDLNKKGASWHVDDLLKRMRDVEAMVTAAGPAPSPTPAAPAGQKAHDPTQVPGFWTNSSQTNRGFGVVGAFGVPPDEPGHGEPPGGGVHPSGGWNGGGGYGGGWHAGGGHGPPHGGGWNAGGDGGGGPGGGGAGTGIPGAADSYDRTNKRELDYAKILDDKIAGTEPFRFNGGQ